MAQHAEVTARDNEAVWLAQLAEMPLAVILAYLRERGMLSGGYYRQDMLPPGYPPAAEYDLPFDALEDARS
jgi:hypothetical protein